MTDNWLTSADYDAWRMGSDDGDTDNSLSWADGLEDSDGDAAGVPRVCPLCDAVLVDDPPDPDTGHRLGVVYCDEPDCLWPGQTYA